jgi:nucleotide-binding universal stress UspA family protein
VVKILVAYDGSEHSRRALEWAARLDGKPEVSVISVAPALEDSPKIRDAIDPRSDVELHRRELNEAATILGESGVEAETLLKVGHPAEEIIDTAIEGEFDLIIIGIHGMSAMRRFLIGSVADRVVRHALVPVLVAR